jgi:hypothetical protein
MVPAARPGTGKSEDAAASAAVTSIEATCLRPM